MPREKTKKVPVDWLVEARLLSLALDKLPTVPNGGLLGEATPAMHRDTRKDLNRVRASVTLEIGYALAVRHKVSIRLPDGGKGLFDLTEVRRPAHLERVYRLVTDTLGIELTKAEQSAFDTLLKLTTVLRDRWVSADWKRDLPIAVAAMGGVSTAHAQAERGSRPRAARDPDWRKVANQKVRRYHPGEHWKERLTRLEGNGQVTQWDGKRVCWADGTEISVRTFCNWR